MYYQDNKNVKEIQLRVCGTSYRLLLLPISLIHFLCRPTDHQVYDDLNKQTNDMTTQNVAPYMTSCNWL